jgi:hypothetical protein
MAESRLAGCYRSTRSGLPTERPIANALVWCPNVGSLLAISSILQVLQRHAPEAIEGFARVADPAMARGKAAVFVHGPIL